MADIVIIGAGAIGAASALALKEADSSLEVVVIEPDYSYRYAATGKGTGGIRQLFTRPENILLSQVTLDAIDDWQSWGTVGDEPAPDLGWQQNGYLFAVGEADVATLERNYETQLANGVVAEWIDKPALLERFPEIVADDLVAAVLSTRDGWLKPGVFFDVLRRKAAAAGVDFRQGRVTTLNHDGPVVRSVRLASGETLPAAAVVNAAGVHAPDIARQLGIELPVEPMRRHEHYIETSEEVSHLPFFKDVHGLAVHAFNSGISVGLVDFDHPGGEDFTIDPSDYPDRVLPALHRRFSGFGELTLRDSWTGLYDQNRFDGNMIIGNVPGWADNLFTACGFSGHGFMHAIGVGRALAELVLYDEYRTLDLSKMSYQRIIDNSYYGEQGVR